MQMLPLAVTEGLTPFYAASPTATKGRLIRCTVPGSTPKRFAILRTPSVRPGALRAARVALYRLGAVVTVQH